MQKKEESKSIIDSLHKTHRLSFDDSIRLLKALCSVEFATTKLPDSPDSFCDVDCLNETDRAELCEYLHSLAREQAVHVYGKKVYMRGLIEFTNYCKNDCLYCGIRRGNRNADRYRLTKDEILHCCDLGHEIGIRTFVLQGGEDVYFTREVLCDIVAAIKLKYTDSAVTLSVGEKDEKTYRAYKAAGVDRYLLRHETANARHYAKLHPSELRLENRLNCLKTLKDLGFQTGTGFMVGSPFQTVNTLAEDLAFVQKLAPQMIGIGPFVAHCDSIFANEKNGSVELTLLLLSILRLLLPNALIPATTALGTISSDGREMGILSGANVVMPNLSPMSARKKYLLYDNKISTGDEVLEGVSKLTEKIASIGYVLTGERGDYKDEGKM